MFTSSPAPSRRCLGTLATLAVLSGAACDEPSRQLGRPNLVHVAGSGQVLVGDFDNARIVRFDASGRMLGTLGRRGIGEGELWRVWGLVGLADGRLAVVDHSLKTLDDPNSFRRGVRVFDAEGRQTQWFDLSEPGDENAGWPGSIDALPDGWVVADQEKATLAWYDRQGRRVRTLNQPEGGPPLVSPGGLCVVGDSVWLTEYRAHRVRRLSLDGRQEVMFGVEGDGPGELLFPQNVDVAPSGWLVVSDLGNYRVQRFDAQGRFLDALAPEPAEPGALVQVMHASVGPDERVYVADSKGGRIVVWRPGVGVEATLASW